jgi:hypothetical protein
MITGNNFGLRRVLIDGFSVRLRISDTREVKVLRGCLFLVRPLEFSYELIDRIAPLPARACSEAVNPPAHPGVARMVVKRTGESVPFDLIKITRAIALAGL